MTTGKPDVRVRVTGEEDGVLTLLKTLSKQLGEVQKGQRKLNDESSVGSKAQQSLAKSVSSTISNLKRLALAYGALRVLHFVDDQLEAADALSKLAQKTGATTEALSVLAFAGETADVSIDDLTVAMRGLAKSSTDLQSGNKDVAASFRAIGLSADDLKGLSVDETFKKVATALGGYQDSLEKADVAQQIFGKAGQNMIPLINQIADEGFDSLTASASKAGRVISAEAGKAAEEFNDQLRLMKGQAQGTALAFAQGVVPALSDVFTVLQDVRGEGEKSLAATFGEQAGRVVRKFGVETITILRNLKDYFAIFSAGGVKAWEALNKAAHLDFSGAKQALRESGDEFNKLNGLFEKNRAQTEAEFAKAEQDREQRRADDRLARERENERKRRIQLVKDEEELAKARAEAEQHARESEGKILAANLALRDQEVGHAFEKGLTSLAQYFAARRKTIVEAGAQEIAALKATRDALQKQPVPASPVERVKRDDQVAQLGAQIREQAIRQTTQLNALDAQREDLAKTLANAVVDAEARMREARGQTSAVAKQKLDEDVQNYATTLAKIGTLSAEQQAKAVSEFRVTLTLDVDAKANQEKIDQLFGEIDRKREELDTDVSLGLRSQADAQRELVQFEKDRLPTMQALADEALRMATALGNPELIANAEALQVKLKGVGQAVSESARLAAEFGTNIAQAAESDLSEFLGSTISQVHSVGEAFASLASSVVGSIQRIVAQLLAAKIVESIAGTLLGIAGGAIAGGLDPTLRAENGFGFGGSTPTHLARGGYVRGPGTATSDSIPARLSDGEYVVRAAAVRRVGVRYLDMLNALRPVEPVQFDARAIAPRRVRRLRRGYADGGLVTGGGGLSPQSVALSLGGSIALDVSHDGTRVQSADVFLKSPQGERAVLDVVVRHRGKIGRIVG